MKRILFATLFLVAVPAFAQQDRGDGKTEDGKTIRYEQNTKIDFDTKVIRGSTYQPTGIHVEGRAAGVFEKLIPERTHFKAELAHSLDKQLAN